VIYGPPAYAEIVFENGSSIRVLPTSFRSDFCVTDFSTVALDGYIDKEDFIRFVPGPTLATATMSELISEIKQRIKTKENLK